MKKKLTLRRDTIRNLNLSQVRGGAGVDTGHSGCCPSLYEGCGTFDLCPFPSDRVTCRCVTL